MSRPINRLYGRVYGWFVSKEARSVTQPLPAKFGGKAKRALVNLHESGKSFLGVNRLPKLNLQAKLNLHLFETRIVPTLFVVNSTADTSTTGTLRYEISKAVAATTADEIQFQFPLATNPNGVTITLESALPNVGGTISAATGKVVSGGNLEIDVPSGYAPVTVTRDSTAAAFGIFDCSDGKTSTFTFANFTISGGSSTADFSAGGILFSTQSVTVSNCTVTGNTHTVFDAANNYYFGAGGIFDSSKGTLTVNNKSVISDNQEEDDGTSLFLGSLGCAAGIGGWVNANGVGGTINITDSTVSGNTGILSGAGVSSYAGTINLSGATISDNILAGLISGNPTDYGGAGVSNGLTQTNTGAVVAIGTTTIGNFVSGSTTIPSTIQGNISLDYGGGIMTTGALTIKQGTLIEGNVALAGGSAIATTEGATGAISLDNSTITGNATYNAANYPGYGVYLYPVTGGAIWTGGGTTTITVTDGSTLSDNAGFLGGGIYDSGTGAVSITNSTVSSNSAAGPGGAIYTRGAPITITGSSLSSNTAGTNGGAIDDETTAASISISGSTLSGNSASGNGGGIFASAPSALTITKSSLTGNTASANGGGAYFSGTALTVTNSTISGNSAANSGGGLDTNAGTGTVLVANSTIAQNTAGTGGGISTASGTLTVNNSTVVQNSATSSTSAGGGISFAGSTLALDSTVVAGNTAAATLSDFQFTGTTANVNYSAWSDGFVPNGTATHDLASQSYASMGFQSPLLALNGAAAGTPLTANLNQSSILLDAGDPTVPTIPGSPPAAPTTDERGTGFTRNKVTPDIGALEYGTVAIPTATLTSPNPLVAVTSNITSGPTQNNPYTIVVTYSVNQTTYPGGVVKYSSVAGSTLSVTETDGTNPFTGTATFVSATPSADGTSIAATYQLLPPGGSWVAADNGDYTVKLLASTIFSEPGNGTGSVPATTFGSFNVNVSAAAASKVSSVTINAFNPDTHLADSTYQKQRSRVTDILVTFNGPVSAATFAANYPTTLTRTDVGHTAHTTVNPNVIQTYTGTPPPTGDEIIITQDGADAVDLTFAPVSGTSDAALEGTSTGGYSLTDGGWTLSVGNGNGSGTPFATPNWQTTGTGAGGTGPFTGLYALFGDYGALGTVDASFAQGSFVSALGISYDNSGTTANGFNAAFDFDGTHTVQAGVAQGAFVGNFGLTLT